MPGCWHGPKLSNVDPQPGRKVGEGAFGGGKGDDIPGKRKGEPYTILADKACESSFHARRINKTNSRVSAQCSRRASNYLPGRL